MFSFIRRLTDKHAASHKTARRPRQAVGSLQLGVDSLEGREVYAASITASLGAGGVLFVEGTQNADTLVVRQKNGQISVDGTNINVNGWQYGKINAAAVNSIQVLGLGGNDMILLNSQSVAGQQAITKPAKIWGGDGNDQIVGTQTNDVIFGEFGDDKLWGMAGNDEIHGQVGNDQVMGGDGNDVLHGGYGNDSIWGEAGSDSLYGGWDNDSLYGGLGNDALYGEGGLDYLSGQEGNDLLDGGYDGYADQLRGGAGKDVFVRYYHKLNVGFVKLDVLYEGESFLDFTNGTDSIYRRYV